MSTTVIVLPGAFGSGCTFAAKHLRDTKDCRNSEQVLTTQEQWKAAMIERGWR